MGLAENQIFPQTQVRENEVEKGRLLLINPVYIFYISF